MPPKPKLFRSKAPEENADALVIDSQEMRQEISLVNQPRLFYAYDELEDPEIAAELQQLARTIKTRSVQRAAALIDIGEALTRVKELLPHGQWLPWLETELESNDTQAQRAMAVYREFHKDRDTASLLNPRVAELIARKSTPPAAKQKLLELAQQLNASPSKRMAEDIIRHYKQPTDNQPEAPDPGPEQPATNPAESAAANRTNVQKTAPVPFLKNPPQSTGQNLPTEPSGQGGQSVKKEGQPLSSGELRRHLQTWLQANLQAPNDTTQFQLDALQCLRRHTQPHWGTWEQYTAQNQFSYRADVLAQAINELEPIVRATSTNYDYPKPQRYLSRGDGVAHVRQQLGIQAGITQPQTISDFDALLNYLDTHQNIDFYRPSLPAGVSISIMLWVDTLEDVRSQLANERKQLLPAPKGKIVLTLDADLADLLEFALRNRTFINLELSQIQAILNTFPKA